MQRVGYEWTMVASRFLLYWIGWFFIFSIAFSVIRWTFSIGTDDSDKDGWNRSGLKVHHDYKTGIEYLSDGHGGLVRRETR